MAIHALIHGQWVHLSVLVTSGYSRPLASFALRTFMTANWRRFKATYHRCRRSRRSGGIQITFQKANPSSVASLSASQSARQARKSSSMIIIGLSEAEGERVTELLMRFDIIVGSPKALSLR
jgi:hypothetical protein